MKNNLKFIVFFFLNFLPIKISNLLIFLAGCFIYRKSHSQYGEDLMILEYLKSKNIKNGTYLDIGGFHPKWISNTHILHKHGFTGYIVDLEKDKLKYFSLIRGKKVKLIHAAISKYRYEYIKFYKFKRFFGFSELDTISKKEAERIKNKQKINYQVKKVKNIYINELFKMTGKINVLNLDLEGIDFELIEKCNFDLIKPELILFEDNLNYFATKKMINFFKKKKFKLLFQSGGTKCFAK